MSELLYGEFRERHDGITIPRIWVALALSVLLHIALLGKWLPQVHLPALGELAPDESARSLVVQLAPPRPAAPPPVPPAPSVKAPPAAVLQAPPRAARPQPAPPVMALNKPAPQAPPAPPANTPPPVPAPAPAVPSPGGDLSSYIEARRRSRNESTPPPAAAPQPAPPIDDEKTRADRAVVANLGLNRAPTFGPDRAKTGGGIFQIQRIGYSDAEFYFYGWNKDIRRNTTQMIEVRKGENSSIQLAVVRKMISIIREYENEDFTWESPRLHRVVTLSARQRDNSGLEDFMLQEFFLANGSLRW